MHTMNRRSFVALTGLGAAATLLPLSSFAALTRIQKTLVLVEFNGGNDGLNTVIPTKEAAYKRLRPTIAIPEKQQLGLSDQLALHPALKPLMPVFDDGDAGLVLGLGYPAPNRSHFRSIEIWDTASASNEFLTEGWLSSLPKQTDVDAVVFGRNALPAMGRDRNVVVLKDLATFLKKAEKVSGTQAKANNSALAHILQTEQDTIALAENLTRINQTLKTPLQTFEGGAFGAHLRDVATMIQAGVAPPVVKVALSGFDTHQAQRIAQDTLLTQFSDGLAQFRQVLKSSGHWSDVLVMSYSEFGRRVAENGSQGTDHGTAAPHFVLGGSVNGGLYGAQPSLDDLHKGDLKFTTDFRTYYQTVLSKWFKSGVELSNETLGFLS